MVRFCREGVSPVIAIILIVAITVVLAAVLYVMIAGMVSHGGSVSPAPIGGWNTIDVQSNSSALLTFGNFLPPAKANDLRIIIECEDDSCFNLWWSAPVESTNYTLTCDDPNITAFYHDYNPAEGTTGGGDYIALFGLKKNTYYYVKVFYLPTSSIIEMAGPTSFQTKI